MPSPISEGEGLDHLLGKDLSGGNPCEDEGRANGARVLIIGTGAIASFLGDGLATAGYQVSFVGRQGPVQHRYEIAGGIASAADAPARVRSFPACDAASLAETRLVFIAVKAFQLEAAWAHVTSLPRGCIVVPVVNGAVWDQILAMSRSSSGAALAWRLGYATVGVTQDAPRCFQVRAKKGEICMGPTWSVEDGPGETQEHAAVPSAFEKNLLQRWPVLTWHANVFALQRRKWLYNTVINTLCAARCHRRNGDLLVDIPTLTSVFNEALLLGETLWGPFSLDRASLYQGLLQLIEATADNENSMARDVRLALPTESDYLAGLVTKIKDTKNFPLLLDLHRKISKPRV